MHYSSRSHSRRRFAAASLTLTLLCALQSASAATQYWDPSFTPTANAGEGSGGDGTWATATGNWSNGTVDGVLVTTNVAGFSGVAGSNAITLPTATSVLTGGLSFESNNYAIGNGATTGQIFISTQAPTDTNGILVGSGVTGTSIDVGAIRLGSSGSGVSILLSNTDLVDFKNTTIYLSGSRTTKISNSSAAATTTFAKFAVSDKPTGGTWTNAAVQLNQGNLTINSLAGAAVLATGVPTTFGGNATATAFNTNFSGTSTGTLAINGNNTLFNNSGTSQLAQLTFIFNMANGTLALGHDNALGARNASNALTGTNLQVTSGTVVASGGARLIENPLIATGSFTVGGTNDIAFAGNVTNSGGNRTVTVNNVGSTTLSGNVFLANDNVTARTLTIAGTSNVAISGAITNNSGANTLGSGLTLNSAGTLTLSNANNTYSGNTNVTAGTLLVSGTHNLASSATTGAYVVASGAKLAGTGTINLAAGSNNQGVTIATGGLLQASSADSLAFAFSGTGTLDLTGALANASPSLFFTLDAPGSTVISATSASIGSGLLEFADFSFSTTGSFGAGDYTLLELTSIAGSLGSSLTGTVGGLDAVISLQGNDVILSLAAIPEPSTLAGLAGLTALAFVASRRRRA